MKKTLFFVASLLGTSGYGQEGFFLQPVAGAGITNERRTATDYPVVNGSNAMSFDGGILAGYKAGRWIYSTGLVYLSTGTKIPITLTDALGNPISTSSITYSFSHLVLPLTVGRAFSLGKMLALTPSAGVSISYNMGASEKSAFDNSIIPMSAREFNDEYQQISCFGLLQAELAFKLSKALSLTCAPSFDYMLTNMTKSSYYAQHDYALLLNIGVRWQLKVKNGK
jgi:hypothetical protein